MTSACRRLGGLAAAMGLLAAGTASAAELVLPPTEAVSDWQDALLVSGLAQVPGSARIERGPPWVLVLVRPDGTVVRKGIAPPTTPEAREAAAILAASVLRPVSVPIALPPLVEPPEPEPEPEPPPPPRPPPKPPPEPEPEPQPEPEPEPPPAEPAEPQPVPRPSAAASLRVSMSVGALARATPDQGTGVGTLGVCTIQPGTTESASLPVFFELGALWAWTPETDPGATDRDLVSSSVWVGTGLAPRTGLPTLGVAAGGMGRRYRFAGSPVATVDVPWVGIGTSWDPAPLSGARGGLRVVARLERDLRQTILASEAGAEGAVSRWGGVLAVTGRWGPPLGPRDTAPGESPDPTEAKRNPPLP